MSIRDVELVESRPLSPSVRGLRLRCLDQKPLAFVAGQWVNLWLEVEGQKHKRAYSIAGLAAPGQEDSFELAVTRVEGGAVSAVLHAAAPGARFAIDGPHGFFTRAGLLDQPTMLVGTGTGLAPLRAMLHEATRLPTAVPVGVLFGCRHQADILWRDELMRLSAESPLVTVHVTLSRPDGDWRGMTGYVQSHLPALIDPARKPHVFVCGLTPMIKQVRRTLKEELGYDRRRIHSERFD